MAFCFNSNCRVLRLATHWHPLFSTTQLKSHHEIRLFTVTATAAAAAQIPHDSEIFNYTSGRWLYNENKRFDERRLIFNVSALLEAAAKSVYRTKDDIKSFCKLAEGGFNRVFEFTMRDGLQVIARLPYPSTQPKLLATASEVATMDLVRRHGVPTPIVYGYSADANNPVGSEYIMMEKVPGRCLGDIWYELSDKERVRVLGSIVDQEAKLFGISFPAYGSVYNTADLPQHMGHAKLEAEAGRFCVGPDVSLKYWFETRSQLEISRSAAMTCQQVLEGGPQKELAWLQTHGKPRLSFDGEYREMFGYNKVDPGEHVSSLENYLKIAAYIVPHQDWLCKPVIRHPDLNQNNIFVDDDCKITSIIDWQHTTVLPLFLHAGIPQSLQNYGDPDSEALKKPEYPSNLDELDEDDRKSEIELYRRRHTHFYYTEATCTKLSSHYDALAHDKGLVRKRLYCLAVEPWEGNSIPLKANLALVAKCWSEFMRTARESDYKAAPCPISFQEKDAEETVRKSLEQEKMDKTMRMLRDGIGISTNGWVSFEKYDYAVAAANEVKAMALGFAESDHEREMIVQHWPFADFDEDG